MMKIGSSPIPCHKRSSATKTNFFIINFVTILASSLIYDDSFSSLKISETSQNLVHEWCGGEVKLTWQHFRDDLNPMWQHFSDSLIRHQIFNDLAGPYGGLI